MENSIEKLRQLLRECGDRMRSAKKDGNIQAYAEEQSRFERITREIADLERKNAANEIERDVEGVLTNRLEYDIKQLPRDLRTFSKVQGLNLTDEEIEKFIAENKITRGGKTYTIVREFQSEGYSDNPVDMYTIKVEKNKTVLEKKDTENGNEIESDVENVLTNRMEYNVKQLPRDLRMFSNAQGLNLTDEEIKKFIAENKITKDGKTYTIAREFQSDGYSDNPIDMYTIRVRESKEIVNDKAPSNNGNKAKKKENKDEEIERFEIKYNGNTGAYLFYSIYKDGEKTVLKMPRYERAEERSTVKRIQELLNYKGIADFIDDENVPDFLKEPSVLKKVDPTIFRFLCDYGKGENNYAAARMYLANLKYRANNPINIEGCKLDIVYDIPLEDKKLPFMTKIANYHRKIATVKKPTMLERAKKLFGKVKIKLLPEKKKVEKIGAASNDNQKHAELINELDNSQKQHFENTINNVKAKKDAEKDKIKIEKVEIKDNSNVEKNGEQEQREEKKPELPENKFGNMTSEEKAEMVLNKMIAEKRAKEQAFIATLSEEERVMYKGLLTSDQKAKFIEAKKDDKIDEWVKQQGINIDEIKAQIEANRNQKEENVNR